MHVNDLHDDVLALVFQAALPAIKSQLADVRSGLGLLCVCRRWREVALPMVYDTVVVKYNTKGADGQQTGNIKTTLELVADTKYLPVVRKVVIDVCYQTSPLHGLKAVIERMRGAAGEWAGVRKLELCLQAWDLKEDDKYPPAADYEDEITSVSSALAALMPGLHEIKVDDLSGTPIAEVLYGKLVGFYADQLQVLHSSNLKAIPQDRVFARLREVKFIIVSEPLEVQLPRLNPEVVESLVLEGLTANDMWSMFCADSDGCAVTFPRLTNLDLRYLSKYIISSGQLSDERPWALQFPVAKRVQIFCPNEECPSMENAVFPSHLESLDLSGCIGILSVFAGGKVEVSRNLALSVRYEHDTSNRSIDIANRMLAESNCNNARKLVIFSSDTIPLELITCTGLTHLDLNGRANVDDVMGAICRLPHLVGLYATGLTLINAQTDFSIPECAENEPMAPLDTQLKRLVILHVDWGVLPELGIRVLKYLLLRIPTLKSVYAEFVCVEQIQGFIDEYVQWYPHLANIKFVR